MAKQDEYIRITTRIPPELRDALVELAKRTERSLNGELIARLQIAVKLAMDEPRPRNVAEQETTAYSVRTIDTLLALIEDMSEEKRKALINLLTL